MAMKSLVSSCITEINLRSSASSLRYFSGVTSRVPSEVEHAKETGFFKKMEKRKPWEQEKPRKLKRLQLATHYAEVNYRTLKAVVFYSPDIRHMGIPHGLRGEGGGGKDGEIR